MPPLFFERIRKMRICAWTELLCFILLRFFGIRLCSSFHCSFRCSFLSSIILSCIFYFRTLLLFLVHRSFFAILSCTRFLAAGLIFRLLCLFFLCHIPPIIFLRPDFSKHSKTVTGISPKINMQERRTTFVRLSFSVLLF